VTVTEYVPQEQFLHTVLLLAGLAHRRGEVHGPPGSVDGGEERLEGGSLVGLHLDVHLGPGLGVELEVVVASRREDVPRAEGGLRRLPLALEVVGPRRGGVPRDAHRPGAGFGDGELQQLDEGALPVRLHRRRPEDVLFSGRLEGGEDGKEGLPLAGLDLEIEGRALKGEEPDLVDLAPRLDEAGALLAGDEDVLLPPAGEGQGGEHGRQPEDHRNPRRTAHGTPSSMAIASAGRMPGDRFILSHALPRGERCRGN